MGITCWQKRTDNMHCRYEHRNHMCLIMGGQQGKNVVAPFVSKVSRLKVRYIFVKTEFLSAHLVTFLACWWWWINPMTYLQRSDNLSVTSSWRLFLSFSYAMPAGRNITYEEATSLVEVVKVQEIPFSSFPFYFALALPIAFLSFFSLEQHSTLNPSLLY